MIRNMTVTTGLGEDPRRPMIRITNNFLLSYGFAVGCKIEVRYINGVIHIIRKTNNKILWNKV